MNFADLRPTPVYDTYWEFAVAGPGAKNGIRKCFGDLTGFQYEDIIKFVSEHQEEEFDYFYPPKWGINDGIRV